MSNLCNYHRNAVGHCRTIVSHRPALIQYPSSIAVSEQSALPLPKKLLAHSLEFGALADPTI